MQWIIELPNSTLGHVVGMLHRVGIDLDPFGLQVMLLAAIALVLLAFRQRLWPVKRSRAKWIVAGGTLVLVGLVIATSWLIQLLLPLPGHLHGVIDANDKADLSVRLVDALGDRVSTGSGSVDTQQGGFLLFYVVRLGNEPRRVVVSKAGCADGPVEVTRFQLRSAEMGGILFQCDVNGR